MVASDSGNGGASARAVGALLFMSSGMYTLDAYSTLNSSPWTAENFGADPEKAKSCKEYIAHAVVYSSTFALASAIISKSLWPIVGSVANNAYLVWLYKRALDRGAVAGSNGWAK